MSKTAEASHKKKAAKRSRLNKASATRQSAPPVTKSTEIGVALDTSAEASADELGQGMAGLDWYIRPGPGEEYHLRRAFIDRGVSFLDTFAKRASNEIIAKALSAPTVMGMLAQAMTSFVFEERTLDARDRFVAAAIAEGARYKEELLERAGGAYTAEQIGEVLGGKSRQAIAEGRKTNLYFGVPVGRGYAYPKCQVTESGTMPGLRQFLEAFSLPDPWMKLAILLEPTPRLEGRSPLEALKQGEIESAVGVAKSYGLHGA